MMSARAAHVHGCHERALERGFVLFDVQCHLFVARTRAHGQKEKANSECYDADGGRGTAEPNTAPSPVAQEVHRHRGGGEAAQKLPPTAIVAP